MTTESTDPARRAYERIREKADGRIVEPFEAFRPSWETESIACLSSTPTAPMEFFSVKGKDNFLFYGHDTKGIFVLNISGNRNTVYVGPFCDVSGVCINISQDDSIIFVGAFTNIGYKSLLRIQKKESSIFVGERSYIGDDCIIANSDGHGIYSLKDGKRINPDRDVVIGDHAFVGSDARINKGTIIEPGGIVLEGSVVSGKIRTGCVHQGIPATLREQDVAWFGLADAESIGEAEEREARLLEERMAILRRKGQPTDTTP